MPKFTETRAGDVRVGDLIIMNGTGVRGRVTSVKRSPIKPEMVLLTIEGFSNQHGDHIFRSHENTRHYIEEK